MAVCPPGFWCNSGKRQACLAGSYQPSSGQSTQEACIQCPDDSSTLLSEATSLADCVCNEGYYNAYPAGTGVVECRLCPFGTSCDARGVSLRALPLRVGYWRPSNDSTQIERCPDAANHGASACIGGTGQQCRESTSGAFCSLCHDKTSYRDGSACVPCSTHLWWIYGLVVFVVVLLLLSLNAAGFLSGSRAPQWYTCWRSFYYRLSAIAARLSLRPKYTVLLGLFQVADRPARPRRSATAYLFTTRRSQLAPFHPGSLSIINPSFLPLITGLSWPSCIVQRAPLPL